MHRPKSGSSRRGIDAMLCLLFLLEACPEIDMLLLSAMIANASELSEWLEDISGRRCLPVAIEWKPTRQARGCVLYDDREIEGLNRFLKIERAQATKSKGFGKKKVNPGKSVRDKVIARPKGLFSLHQTWNSTNMVDYSLVELLEDVHLGVNEFWSLTPNKNEVAGWLGIAFARLGLKTLVFIQNRKHAHSLAVELCRYFESNGEKFELQEYEQQLMRSAQMELGTGKTYCLPIGASTSHHALLLPSESLMNETRFRRLDGCRILCATPTLAQGMNLPADVVVIAGEERYEDDGSQALEDYEVLNAAGRAGRAGYSSFGLVVVVPSKVTSADFEKFTPDANWFKLQREFFGKSDQCLAVEDPLQACLDQVQLSSVFVSSDTRYLISRIPNSADTSFDRQRILRRSLSGHKARKEKREKSFESKIAAACSAKDGSAQGTSEAIESLSFRLAISPKVLQDLEAHLRSLPKFDGYSVTMWVEFLLGWLRKHPAVIDEYLGAATVCKLMNIPVPEKEIDIDWDLFLARLKAWISGWIGGKVFSELEQILGVEERSIGYCDRSRAMALKVMPKLSYLCGAVVLMVESIVGTDSNVPMELEILSLCIKYGFEEPISLAVFMMADDPKNGRVWAHQKMVEAKQIEPSLTEKTTFNEVRRAIPRKIF